MIKASLSAILCAFFLLAPSLFAQTKKPAFGPVVTAYLTGLKEELNELDFQLRQKELTRADYERTRQRLLILRRLVQARAAQSKADKLPELQVLLLEEFGMVGLSKPPENEGLQLGAVFDESWKLIGIEKTKPPFYVFEKVPLTQAKAHEQMMERQSQKTFDPSEVIETIVVPDPQPPQPQPQPNQAAQPRATRPRTVTAAHNRPAPTPEDEEDGVGKSAFAGPRMLTSHLPAYTEQALAKGVEGELIVAALFRRDGRIEGITVVKGLGYGLDEHAVEAVERLDFAPARLAEQAVDARAEIVYTFTLSKVSVRFRNVAAQ